MYYVEEQAGFFGYVAWVVRDGEPLEPYHYREDAEQRVTALILAQEEKNGN